MSRIAWMENLLAFESRMILGKAKVTISIVCLENQDRFPDKDHFLELPLLLGEQKG